MLNQIKILTALELKNLYGWNTFKYTKDKSEKNRFRLLLGAWIFVIAMVVSYVGGLAYGLIYLGAEELVYSYLCLLASFAVFMFVLFKAGSVIFGRYGYENLCALPFNKSTIVVSRFLRMYVEDLIITAVVMVPGFVIYGIFAKAGLLTWVIGILSMLVVPVLPLIIATLFGAGVAAISSRMKKGSLISAVLSIAFVLVIMFGSSALTKMEESFSVEMLAQMSELIADAIGKLYPPAIWLGNAVNNGDALLFLACAAGLFALFVVTMMLVSVKFHVICQGLFGTTAKHDYKMQTMKKNSVLMSLFKREWKRYFSSSIYLTNTIIGPALGVAFAIALVFMEPETLLAEITAVLPITIDLNLLVPFMVAAIVCLMTTTCTSISMEGKNWWMIKTLPLSTKDILDAKMLLNLALMAPAYVVAIVCFVIGLHFSLEETLYAMVVMAAIMIFATVFGITANLALPKFDWTEEVAIVKQSASAGLSMVGSLVIFVSAIVVMLVPANLTFITKWGVCLLYLIVTMILYKKNSSKDLRKLN